MSRRLISRSNPSRQSSTHCIDFGSTSRMHAPESQRSDYHAAKVCGNVSSVSLGLAELEACASCKKDKDMAAMRWSNNKAGALITRCSQLVLLTERITMRLRFFNMPLHVANSQLRSCTMQLDAMQSQYEEWPQHLSEQLEMSVAISLATSNATRK